MFIVSCIRAISLSASSTQLLARVIPQCETELTKIDSSQNTPELMDVSVIDINTWERAGARAADETQSAPIRGAIFIFISHVGFVLTWASVVGASARSSFSTVVNYGVFSW